jgi:hypothetical protein
MLQLLENVKNKAFDEGEEEGYYEGYEKGRSLASEDKQNDRVFEILRREDEEKARDAALEEGKKLGRKEEFENKKKAEKQACENSWREGHETGLNEGKEEQEVTGKLAYEKGKTNGQLEERENWVMNHGEGLCVSLEVSTPRVRLAIDASTQAAPTTIEATTQTDATTTVDVDTQTAPLDEPTAPPSLPPLPATSLLTMPAQPPSTTPSR